MTEALASIIADLELRKSALDTAITALHEINGDTPERVPGSTATASPAKRKGFKRSAAVRKRMAEAQRKRWELKRSGK